MAFIDFLGKPFLRGVQFLWAFIVVGLLVVVGGCCFGFGCCCLAVAGFCWFVMVLGMGWPICLRGGCGFVVCGVCFAETLWFGWLFVVFVVGVCVYFGCG